MISTIILRGVQYRTMGGRELIFEESNSAALKRQRASNLRNWSADTEGEGRT